MVGEAVVEVSWSRCSADVSKLAFHDSLGNLLGHFLDGIRDEILFILHENASFLSRERVDLKWLTVLIDGTVQILELTVSILHVFNMH